MPFLKICSDDKLVVTLQSVFKANILRIPEERIRPLTVIANTSGKSQFWGYLNELIEGDFKDVKSIVQTSIMADISGKASKSVNLDLGLQILEGFLGGFGLPSAAITAHFTGAKTVSFSFQDVVRYFISPGQLGNIINGKALDAEKPSNGIFFHDGAQLLVIDSIITSKDFSINVDASNTQNFSLDIPAIEKIVGQAKTGIAVASNTGLDIKFQGNIPLTFAFTCLICSLDKAGRITLKPSSGNVRFGIAPSSSVDHQLLYDESCMIEWGDLPGGQVS